MLPCIVTTAAGTTGIPPVQAGDRVTVQDIEGRIGVRVSAGADGISSVEIVSTRRSGAGRFLEGRPVAEALQALALLFSLCGTAQMLAGTLACEQASGIAVTAAERARRAALVAAESSQEHAARLLLDWPVLFLDSAPQIAELAAIRQAVSALREALGGGIGIGAAAQDSSVPAARAALARLRTALAHGVYGMAPGDWARIRDGEALRAWAEHALTTTARTLAAVAGGGLAELGRSAFAALPPFSPAALATVLDGDDAEQFCAAPLWNGMPCETGPLARQFRRAPVAGLVQHGGNGILARLAARLTELALLPRQIEQHLRVMERGGVPRASGRGNGAHGHSGTGIVETARGRLVHRVHLRDGIVRRYRILAPTEWNFHPHGPLARSVQSLPAGNAERLRRHVGMLVVALDPCVAYEVIIGAAGTEGA